MKRQKTNNKQQNLSKRERKTHETSKKVKYCLVRIQEK